MSRPSNEISLMQQFAEDDIFKKFLDDNVDIKALAATATVAVNEQLAKLASGISLLNKELHDQVSHHYEDLLSQATEIETLETFLQVIYGRIQTLMATAERLRSKVVEPFDRVANQTSTLSKLQEACDILRRINRILQLSQRLQEHLKEDRDKNITKAAQCLHELDYIIGVRSDLNAIKILENDLRLIKDSRLDVEKQAQIMLDKGIKNLDPNLLGTSLQVFHNLQVLVPTVQKVVSLTTENLRKDVENALDINRINKSLNLSAGKVSSNPSPGGASMVTIGTTAQLRATFWNNVEKMTEDIYNACAQMHFFQRILAKKRDPVSHVLFSDELVRCGVPHLMLSFWNEVTTILTETLSNMAKSSSFVSQAFEGQFPKLLRMYLELWKRLQSLSGSAQSENSTSLIFVKDLTGHYDPERQLRSTLVVFENSYLKRSSSTLLDKVNLAFLQLDVSSSAQDISSETKDIEAIIDIISREAILANFDPILSKGIAQNITQTVQLLTEKCGKLVTIDEDAVQVIDSSKPSQILIGKTAHILALFQQKMLAFLDSKSAPNSEATEIILTSLQLVDIQIGKLVTPLLQSVSKFIEAIIITMHQEDFSGKATNSVIEDSKTAEQPCSPYMRELQSFIDRSHKNYFSLYPSHPVVQKNLQILAGRAIDFFVRHASLIRPLEEKGKMKLAADFAQMEMALAPLCDKLGDLGRPYRMLRSFRPLLFQTPQHISTSPVIGDIVPYSVVLQFLFSRGPNQLKSPYQASDWTVEYYSKWLDENSESKRLALIRSTLDSYAQMVKQRKEKEFTSIYPVMMEILHKALAIHVEA